MKIPLFFLNISGRKIYIQLCRIAISFKEARDTFYIKEILDFIKINHIYNPIYITTDQISNVRCVLNKISSINWHIFIPRYIFIFQNDIMYFKKFSIYFKYIDSEEVLMDENTIKNLKTLMNKFIPNKQKKYKVMNDGLQVENKMIYKNKYIVNHMERIEYLRKSLFDIYNYMQEVRFEEELYTANKIHEMLNKIKDFSEICYFNELVSLGGNNNYNLYEPLEKIFLPLGYINDKKRYESHFNVILEIDDEKDYFYAYCFSMFYEPLLNVYNKINVVIPNVLSKSVYNAMLVLNADDLIFKDKINKGVIIKRVTKSVDDEIVDIEFEEIEGMYENIFGKVELK